MRLRLAPFAGFAVSLAAIAVLAWAYDELPSGEASRKQLWGLGQSNYHEFREKLNARRLPALHTGTVGGLSLREPGRVTAAPAGGIFEPPLVMVLRADGRIHYTLDGSIPTQRSRVYEAPLVIDSSVVVRARLLPRGALPGTVSTWHFIEREPSDIAAVSIATDPVGLWNKYSGIYANPTGRGREWERAAHVAYFPTGRQTGIDIPAELRIHGGYSRLVAKKSFRFRFDASAVSDLPDDHVLRAGALNGTNTVVIRGDAGNPAARIRDALASRLYESLGGIVSAAQPVEVYLNGDYWGLYDLREYVGPNFLPARFGPGSYEHLAHDSENVERWVSPIIGTRDGWDETIRLLASASGDGARSAIDSLFDVDATLDYWLHNIIIANVDWPYNNAHVFRQLDGADRRWKWIAWDMDPAFIHTEHNTLAWALRDRVRNDLKWNYQRGAFEDREMFLVSTLPLRVMLRDPAFRDRFIARAQVLLQLHYSPDRVLPVLDSTLAVAAEARARDGDRWGWADSTFTRDIEHTRTFIHDRPAHVLEHLAQQFELGDPVDVRIRTTGPGTVTAEGYPLPPGGTTLRLLRGTRLHLEAIPDEGAAVDPSRDSTTVLEVREPTTIRYGFRRR